MISNFHRLLFRCFKTNLRRENYVTRKLSLHQRLNKEVLTLELLPEVKNSFESGEIKHRKHPGIRNRNAVSVPEKLKTAVDKIISEESEKLLLKESKELCRFLLFRRLPIEKEDIDKHILKKFPEFKGDIEQLSKVLSKQQLKDLKKNIKLELGRWKPVEYDKFKSLVYLVGRLAPNYAAVCHVFDELMAKEPSFKPKTFFDFGSGVGSALWAAHTKWSDTIKEYFCSDASAHMNDLSLSLITGDDSEQKHIYPVSYRQFLPASDTVKYDLVVSAFSLLELQNAAERLKVIDILWRKTQQYLVIIDYGTVAGFSCVSDARDFILKVENDSPEFSLYSSGAHVISPCPHDLSCPKLMEKINSSCGFTVPYYPLFPRKHQGLVFKDFISYVILKKGPRLDKSENLSTHPRIVKPVLKKPRHVICRLCCSDGQLKEVIVTKSRHGRHAYRCARESNQGDILPVILKTVNILDENDEENS